MQERYTLTEAQQEALRKIPQVRTVSARMVQYTAAFKKQVLAARARGEPPHAVFEAAGIELSWFSKEHVRGRVRAWSKIATQHGVDHFDAERRGDHGLSLERWRNKEMRYKQLTDQEKVAYLEAEVEALEYVRRHFQLPPAIHWKPHSSRRRPNTKSSPI